MQKINWQHIDLRDTSNPRITWSASEFLAWLRNWDLEIVGTCAYIAHSAPSSPSTYANNKEAVRDLALKFERWANERDLSYGDFAEWGALFETLGRKFGLLTEFREKAIC